MKDTKYYMEKSNNWICINHQRDERNRALWKLGLVEKIIHAKDKVGLIQCKVGLENRIWKG